MFTKFTKLNLKKTLKICLANQSKRKEKCKFPSQIYRQSPGFPRYQDFQEYNHQSANTEKSKKKF